MKNSKPLNLNFHTDIQFIDEEDSSHDELGMVKTNKNDRKYLELRTQLESLSNENKLLKAELEQLRTYLEESPNLSSKLFESQELQLKQLKSYIRKNMDVLKFFITKSLTKNAKQIESFISLERYLAEDQIPLRFHGWPISPDIALEMAGIFRHEKIDYVIEFGSGTSTILFGKFFSKSLGSTQEKRVLSFDHEKKYLQATRAAVSEHELDDYIDLSYAPITTLELNGSQRSYYDCKQQISDFSKRIAGQSSHILILVDGPPGNLGKQSRAPALEVVLTELSGHHLMFVVDDYNRDEEKEMVNDWMNFLTTHGLKYELEEVDLDKGGALLRVN